MKILSTNDKKTILITVSSLGNGGGISRYILSLCKILKSHYRIVVLTTHDSHQNTFGEKELSALSADIKLIKITTSKKINRYFKTARIIWSLKPDYIINNYNGHIQYVLPYIKRKSKFIHILHSDTPDFYRIGNINSKFVDAWIAPTKGIADKFNDYTNNIHKNKVYVISHGVEDAQSNLIKQNKRLEILFAGVLYEHKGVKELPLIIHQLLMKNVDLHFTIIGAGILEDWLKQAFADEIAKGIVTFTGVIDHSFVYRHMAKADVFLYPTHIDAFGLVIAEAMMNGAVPVVSHIPGVTDNLIEDGKNGFLIKQGDIENFANSILNISNDNLILNRISLNARESAKSKLSIMNMQDCYLKFLQNINK